MRLNNWCDDEYWFILGYFVIIVNFKYQDIKRIGEVLVDDEGRVYEDGLIIGFGAGDISVKLRGGELWEFVSFYENFNEIVANFCYNT